MIITLRCLAHYGKLQLPPRCAKTNGPKQVENYAKIPVTNAQIFISLY